MTANHVGGAQETVRRPAREAVAHSAWRAQRAVGVEAVLGAGVALALPRDHILCIDAHSATQKEHCCCSSQPQVSTAYSLLVLHNCSVFVLFALVQAAPDSHALSGQLHKVVLSWSLASDFPAMRASRYLPGPQTRVSCCTFRAAYSLLLLSTRCAASNLPSCIFS